MATKKQKKHKNVLKQHKRRRKNMFLHLYSYIKNTGTDMVTGQ